MITSEICGSFKLSLLYSEKVTEVYNKELSRPILPSTFFSTGSLHYRLATTDLIKMLYLFLEWERKEKKEIWFSGMSLHIPRKLGKKINYLRGSLNGSFRVLSKDTTVIIIVLLAYLHLHVITQAEHTYLISWISKGVLARVNFRLNFASERCLLFQNSFFFFF